MRREEREEATRTVGVGMVDVAKAVDVGERKGSMRCRKEEGENGDGVRERNGSMRCKNEEDEGGEDERRRKATYASRTGEVCV